MDLLTGLVVGLHIASVHVPAHDNQNNTNLGAYVRTQDGLTAGCYRNTLSRNSCYLGMTDTNLLGPVDLHYGGITGYDKHDGRGWWKHGKVAPMLAISYAPEIRVFGARPRIFYVPAAEKNGSHVLSAAVEF